MTDEQTCEHEWKEMGTLVGDEQEYVAWAICKLCGLKDI